jgi:hypothetical protein
MMRVRAGMMIKNQIFKLLFLPSFFNIKSLASPMTLGWRQFAVVPHSKVDRASYNEWLPARELRASRSRSA